MLDCCISIDTDSEARLGIIVVSSGSRIFLTEKGNLLDANGDEKVAEASPLMRLPLRDSQSVAGRSPFLRVPPFPGAAVCRFAEIKSARSETADLTEAVRRLRVGGTYWATQPNVPDHYLLLRCPKALKGAQELVDGQRIVLSVPATTRVDGTVGVTVVSGDCDPWHMLSKACALVADPNDELRIIAGLLGIPTYLYDERTGELVLETNEASDLLASALFAVQYENPFTGDPMSVRRAIELCGYWRQLIDSNREIQGGIGFAFWKQNHVAPLLWDGHAPFRFLRGADATRVGAPVAVWQAKLAPATMSGLRDKGVPLIEVEDGFLRSQGLGADCVPPLSITVDRLGVHFDPAKPSELELLIEDGRFDDELLQRACEVRRLIVEAGIGKYERGVDAIERRSGTRRHILVPGQVEDDRAVITGGCGLVSNLDLIARVRAQAPDAYIIYKPHPDVLAGHRRGEITDSSALRFADEIVGGIPIASLIEMVDEVHVNTSLAGFEGLLRGKEVTTYGVPFYAGWGLTRDLGPVPLRRTAKRSIDELVAATLLLYPRYLDPVTGLPCPAEIVVSRLSASESSDAGLIVGVRRLQGKLMRRLRSLVL